MADFAAHRVPEQRPLEALATLRLADYLQLQALQVMGRVHPLMKDANDRDAVVGDLIVIFWCRLRDYSALRASPLTGPPCGRSTSLRDVVEPIFFMSGVRPTC